MTEVEVTPSSVTPDTFVKGNEHRDYSIYTRLMDAALEAKAASLFPHFGEVKHKAIIVDAGSGTGALAELAAEYFRGAHVFALDISHELMERAENGRSLTEMVFGDAADQNFPSNSVDIKYFSTSGHELESYGGKGRMTQAVETTYDELKPGGKIVIRDFAKPSSTSPIYMQVPTEDGVSNSQEATINGFLDYNLLSTRALFDQFHQEFAGGNAFTFELVERNGQEYIKLAPEWAHEFYLRKDYTANWRQEIHEKYTYWTPDEAKTILTKAGYTDVQIIPDPNHYILENRLLGKIGLFEENGDGKLQTIPFPPTHMVIVGTKPLTPTPTESPTYPPLEESLAVDYAALKQTISYNQEHHTLSIGDKHFSITEAKEPAHGSKKITYWLHDDPRYVVKVARTDAPNDHTIFKAMYQSIMRESILKDFNIPHAKIVEVDPKGPPYRYYLQEALPEGSQSAAELILQNGLTETDIAQMASYVNTFELEKKWQLDTNPFNWYRVIKEDGTTEMTYVDGKVYRYDELWEFRRVGLLQWTSPEYVTNAHDQSATIPKVKEYVALRDNWAKTMDENLLVWKQHLHPSLQP